MSDVFCPYCNHEQEINHDDGYGYEEGETHEQECGECDKTFIFTTFVSYSYFVYCENEDEHILANSEHHPDLYSCQKCDYCEVRK